MGAICLVLFTCIKEHYSCQIHKKALLIANATLVRIHHVITKFHEGIPDYPVESGTKTALYGANDDEKASELPSYIPSFMPPYVYVLMFHLQRLPHVTYSFPEPHTFRSTLVNATKPLTDPTEVMQTVLEQKLLARKSLGKIHQKELETASETGKPMRFGEEPSEETHTQELSATTAATDSQVSESTSNINLTASPPKPARAFR